MKRLLSVLLSLMLVLSSFSGVYAKSNGKGNDKREQAQINKWKQELKKFHKDTKKREELIKKIAEEKKKSDDKSILIFVNGEEVDTKDLPPVIKSGRILLPVAPITKALGASLKYDEAAGKITITKGSTVVVIYVKTGAIWVNGKEVKLETPAARINNKVYVPISFIKKILQHDVEVDDDSDAVVIEEEVQTTVSFNDSLTGTGNNQFKYSNGWTYAAKAGAYQNDVHYSNTSDAYVEVKFRGTQIKLYGTKDIGYGIAAVSIDGGRETTVDLYAGSLSDNTVLYSSPVLPNGQHTLKVRVTGNKNTNAANYYVAVDRVEITGPNLTPPPVNTTPAAITLNNSQTGTGSNQFNYSGTWTQYYETGPYLNDYHGSATTGSFVEVKFEGRQIKLYGSRDASFGIASVIIDGTVETLVDMYASSRSDNVLLYTSPLMANGVHTLQIKVTGTKNSASGNYIVAVDKVEITGDSTAPAGNLALNKSVTASSFDDTARNAGKAVDGKMDTNWYSQYSDAQWLIVDLGAQYAVSRVKLHWETAYGKAYTIQVSADGSNWSAVYSTTSGDGGLDDITFTAANARYVKLAATERATRWGYSLKEIEVFN